jgi:predicted DNA-binding transcriptional regulator YafY
VTTSTARVLALLEILQGGGLRTVPDLAARLGVDERTVRRYVGHLLELGVPVDSVRGRYGGYRLAPGYRMPPLMLTDEEALAVLLGLLAGRRAGLVTTSAAAGESATAKLLRVLPAALRRRLDALLDTADFTARTPYRHRARRRGYCSNSPRPRCTDGRWRSATPTGRAASATAPSCRTVSWRMPDGGI